MKKLLLCIAFIAITVHTYAQIGIGTVTPQATLDVEGKPTITTVLDGIIPPRLTGNQLQNKTYTSTQNGTIVYVTQTATSPSGQIANVKGAGLYIFNASINQWIALSNPLVKNVFCNNDDPNSGTIFDDVLPAVAHDAALIQNTEYTYYGLDGSVWVWNGTNYVTFSVTYNLNVGERASVYKTMTTGIANGTHLPAAGLIELDGLIRIGLNKWDINFCTPYIRNISLSAINVTFTSAAKGSSTENRQAVQVSIAAGATQGMDANDIMYWNTGNTEALTSDVILQNGKWYEIQWMFYQTGDNTTGKNHIFMTVIRKF